MRNKILALLTVLSLGLTSVLFAAEKVNNKFCPISGEGVSEMGAPIEYEYNGKIYNFCCKMCLKDFKKDPEAYIKKMEAKEPGLQGAVGTAEKDEHAGHGH